MTLLARRPVRQALSAYETMFIALARAYVEKYPQTSFAFRFERAHRQEIGSAPGAAEVAFTNSAAIWKDILTRGSCALGEAYCAGHIHGAREDVTKFLELMLRISEEPDLRRHLSLRDKLQVATAAARSKGSLASSRTADVNAHYSLDKALTDPEVSNEFFLTWLGREYPVYSCAYWGQGAKTLVQGQIDKFEHYIDRLPIRPGQSILELGCGWGAQGMYYARQYDLRVTLITLSRAQASHIRQRVAAERLEDRVTLLEMDMMDIDRLDERFDRIISLGAIEHIADFDALFGKAAGRLKPGGRALFHTMFNEAHHEFDAWNARYMWPGVRIPSRERLLGNLGRHFQHVDFEVFAPRSYSRTFEIWAENFFEHETELLKILCRGDAPDPQWLLRAFKYYLMCCSVVYNVYMDVGNAVCWNGQ